MNSQFHPLCYPYSAEYNSAPYEGMASNRLPLVPSNAPSRYGRTVPPKIGINTAFPMVPERESPMVFTPRARCIVAKAEALRDMFAKALAARMRVDGGVSSMIGSFYLMAANMASEVSSLYGFASEGEMIRKLQMAAYKAGQGRKYGLAPGRGPASVAEVIVSAAIAQSKAWFGELPRRYWTID